MQDMSQPAHVRNDSREGHVIEKKWPVFLGNIFTSVGQVEVVAEGRAIEELIGSTLHESSGEELLASRPRKFLEDTLATGASSPSMTSSLNAALARTEERLPALDTTGFDPADFFDRERGAEKQYIPGSAFMPNHDASAESLGIAEFVNGEFFSDGTLGSSAYEGPEVDRAAGCVNYLPLRDLEGDFVNGWDGQPRFSAYVSSPGIPHLARCTFHWGAIVTQPELRLLRPDESVLRDYYELLFPLAIQYQSKFLATYFRPRMEVVPMGNNQFRLVNFSEHDFTFQVGALELIYEIDPGVVTEQTGDRGSIPYATDGSGLSCRDSLGGQMMWPEWMNTLGAAPAGATQGPESSFVCEMPSALPQRAPKPAAGSRLWVVARGSLGDRGYPLSPSSFDQDPDSDTRHNFVTMFARAPLPKILFGSGSVTDVESLDAEKKADIWSVEVDLQRIEQAVDYVEPESQNITGPIRDLLDVQEVDFFSPALRPGTTMLAMRTDHPFEPAGQGENGAAGIALIDLSVSPIENATRLNQSGIISGSTLTFKDGGPMTASWSQDGEALFFLGSESGGNSGYLSRVLGLNMDMSYSHLSRAVSSYPTGSFLVDQHSENGGLVEGCSATKGAEMVSALTADEVIVASQCYKRSKDPVSDLWVTHEGDEFVRQILFNEDANGDLAGSPIAYFDTVSESIQDCAPVGICFSGHVDGGARSRHPRISPDGSKVAFLRKAPGTTHGRPEANCNPNMPLSDLAENQIWIGWRSGDGGDQMELLVENPLSDPSFYETPTAPAESGLIDGLAWSPDGQWLAFVTFQGCAPGQSEKGNIYVIRVPDAPSGEPVRPLLVARGVDAVLGTNWNRRNGVTWAEGLQLPRGN